VKAALSYRDGFACKKILSGGLARSGWSTLRPALGFSELKKVRPSPVREGGEAHRLSPGAPTPDPAGSVATAPVCGGQGGGRRGRRERDGTPRPPKSGTG